MFFNFLKKKKKKVKIHQEEEEVIPQIIMPSLFDIIPDELMLIILSYGTMEEIQNTRVYQSTKIQQHTETMSSWAACQNNNLDNLKWIFGRTGDIEDFEVLEITPDVVYNSTGNY